MVYDGGRKKIPSIRTLFYVSFLWMRKRKNSFVCQIIFCLLSMMEEEKKLILLQLSFLYVVYDERIEKTPSVVSLFLVSSLWWINKKNLFCYNLIFLSFLWPSKRKNSFCCNNIFSMSSMMKQKKKILLFQHYFLYDFYNG